MAAVVSLFITILLPIITHVCSQNESISNENERETVPNIIIFYVEDLGYRDLGCYGNIHAKTPNIDKLSDNGARFKRWYCQSSGTPGKASVLTGRLPIRHEILKGKYLPFYSFPSIASTGGLRHKEVTIAEGLKLRGYNTGFIGNWGLGIGRDGEFLPVNQGFDYFYGVPLTHTKSCFRKVVSFSRNDERTERLFGNATILLSYSFLIAFLVCAFSTWILKFIKIELILYPFVFFIVGFYMVYFVTHVVTFLQGRSCVLYRNSDVIEQPYHAENMTLRFTREAVYLLELFAEYNNPFLLFMSYLELSDPSSVSPLFHKCSNLDQFGQFRLSCPEQEYLDSLQEIDWSVGQVLKKVEKLGIEENTLVIFTSGNGAEIMDYTSKNRKHSVDELNVHHDVRQTRNSPLRGGKYSIWEGGIKVPSIWRWPGHIPANTSIDSIATCMDIFPSIIELLNQTVLDEDSIDGKSLVNNLMNKSTDTPHQVLFHYNDISRPLAVTFGRYKVHFYTVTGTRRYLLNPPLVFDITEDPGELHPLPVEGNLAEQVANITEIVDKHMINRTSKFSSQFESPLVPWYFPCSNPPYCLHLDEEKSSFERWLELAYKEGLD